MSSLSELGINRQLYKTQPQTAETLGAETVASNLLPPPSTSIASGNSVQDINSNAEQINGEVIEPGTIPPSTLDIANWGWTQTSVFSVTDLDTVAWGLGTFTSANGVAYVIGAGNTGNMSARTYVYLDINISTSAYQISTSVDDPIGVGKVLIAVCENGVVTATYNLVQAHQIVGDNILANTINANRIVAGSITATQINASYVYAGTINANQINAGTITGFTIIGSTLSTATTGQRVVLTTTLAQYYNSSNVQVGTIFGDTAGLVVSSDSGLLRLSGTTTAIITIVGAGNYIIFDLSNNRIIPSSDGVLDLGANGATFKDLWIGGEIRYNGVAQPTQYFGYVAADGSSGTPFPATFSSTQYSTGVYTITFNETFGSTGYTVTVSPLKATTVRIAKIGVRNSGSFTVRISDEAGTLSDSDFMFHVCRTP